MRSRIQRALVLLITVLSFLSTPLQGALAISTFTNGNDGWTQVNLGGDYRFLDEITFGDPCPPNLESNSVSFCDPDAGSWLFEAPTKFLGNQSAALGGFLEYSILWMGDPAGLDPNDQEPDVILVHTTSTITNGLIFKHPSAPPVNTWTTYHVELNEQVGWRYMDDNTPMNDLPLATRDQIAEVLSSISALRIRGEFITGDDVACLRNVILDGPARLSIKPSTAGLVELSWSGSASNYVLQTASQPTTNALWTPLVTSGQTMITLPSTNAARFFRLAQPMP